MIERGREEGGGRREEGGGRREEGGGRREEGGSEDGTRRDERKGDIVELAKLVLREVR